MQSKRLVVIGGGAAGFFCAVNAAASHPGLKVTILEKSNKLLSKVRVSGGGRCNITHACTRISDMLDGYPRGARFLKSLFHQFFTTDTIRWFEDRGVVLKTEEDGRMFPITDNSETIIQCLLREAGMHGVDIRMNAGVTHIEKKAEQWRLAMANGSIETTDFVCIAAGGFSKAEQFSWFSTVGHRIEPPVPSLFTFNMPGNPVTELMGLSVPSATVKINGMSFSETGPLLITHWGMSGPAVLRLSARAAIDLAECQYRFKVQVNWLSQYNENTLRTFLQQYRFEAASRMINNRNPFGLPQRLWNYHLQQAEVPEGMRWADLPAKAQNKLIKQLCAQEFDVAGKTTFKEEFVTCGGVDTTEINHATMESKLCPGLYFAGEVINVDGITGGYNFQNAWTTGWVAAKLGQ